jgi:alpha-ketoglutarate-dependent taurine dioxygenase
MAASFLRTPAPALNGPGLPLEISGGGGLLELVRAERAKLAEKLLTHGALLFRGFEVADLGGFARAFAGRETLFGYAGGASPRKALGGGSYTSTEYPPDMTLSLHNELCYADAFPRLLYFQCLVEPQSGGETTLGDSRRILAAIDPAVADRFRSKGIRYIRNLSGLKGSGYSWQEALETDERAEAEEACRRIGADFEWRADGSLRMSQLRPATAVHPATGEEVWFNQAHGFHPSALDSRTYAELIAICESEDALRLGVTYGDGSPIETGALEHIRAVLAAETIPHRWRQGDILVLDNLLTAHGRAPFSGPRKIALAMS